MKEMSLMMHLWLELLQVTLKHSNLFNYTWLIVYTPRQASKQKTKKGS